MDFYESITHALYCRMETPGVGLTAPLEQLKAYHEQETALEAALSQMGDTTNAERALQAARRLCDLQAHFFYRVDLQDGVKPTASDFPVCGIDKDVC